MPFTAFSMTYAGLVSSVSAETTRVAGVAVQLDLFTLVSGNSDLFSVDDDDKVAAIKVGGISGLVLPTEQVCGLGGQATQYHIGGIDDVPLAVDVTSLRCISRQSDFLVSSKLPATECFSNH